MQLIQVLLIGFALFALGRTIKNFRKRKTSVFGFAFWVLLWLIIIIVALLPGVTHVFTKLFNVGRGVDFLIYISITFLFYMVFKIFEKLERIEEEITEIVKKDALKNLVRKR
ncbi:MAG: DUF2304 family protein [Candidatus Woesearchaeota archaeon]